MNVHGGIGTSPPPLKMQIESSWICYCHSQPNKPTHHFSLFVPDSAISTDHRDVE